MLEEDHLKYFITEDIFLLKEGKEMPEPVKDQPSEQKKIHDIVVWTHELTDKDQALLEKMLKAVHLDLHQVHLIHHEDEYTDQYKTLLSFGHVDFLCDKLEQEIFLNKPIQSEGRSILVSYAITSLRTDVKKKGELWEGLKKMFRV